MKYTAPEYRCEAVEAGDIMTFSSNDIKTTYTTFDYGDGRGEVNVIKGTSTANILDLLFGN